eukprot:6281897-Alexandrium_andersonii.AAC.1
MAMPYFDCLPPPPSFIWPAWSGRMCECTSASGWRPAAGVREAAPRRRLQFARALTARWEFMH